MENIRAIRRIDGFMAKFSLKFAVNKANIKQ
jgi:hypothetical protein